MDGRGTVYEEEQKDRGRGSRDDPVDEHDPGGHGPNRFRHNQIMKIRQRH